MKSRRIHIMGASGAGTTTLGLALAGRLSIPHHDSDNYFWRPTVPPYRENRPEAESLRLMEELFLGLDQWALSGSVVGWAEAVTPLSDFAVFLRTPTEIRVQRLRERETRRFGHDAVAPGAWRHEETEEFLEWASHYDDGSREGRNLAKHEAWLATLSCPILRANGSRPTADLVEKVLRLLADKGS